MSDILSHIRNAARACTDTYEVVMTTSEARQIVALIDRSWQPIETAQKDVDILLCDMRTGTMIVSEWDRDEGRWGTTDGPSYHPSAFTHWMPLPPPPANNPTTNPKQ